MTPEGARAAARLPEHPSTMLERFGPWFRLLVRLAFRHVRIQPEVVAHLQQLARQGTLVYVMRYRSTIDYLLVNAVLLREGLPLARFAPGVSTVAWRSLRELPRWIGRRRDRTPAGAHAACGALVAEGRPVLLFLRSRVVAGRRRKALAAARLGHPFLRDVLRSSAGQAHPTYLVPLAIFRGAGYRRRESRLETMLYSVQEAPGEAKRLFTYVWNAEQTQLSVGREITVQRFVETLAGASEDRVVRGLVRALQIHVHQEERIVHGPALLPRRVVRAEVLRDPELVRLTQRLAAQRGVPRRQMVREARRYVGEMAANFNGLYFAILEFVFLRIWPRVFSGLELQGLDRVIACMKEHPIVLVPCHRSHFDYLILTYIFHTHFLSPPHIAAGINLAFWPMGALFRGAGAFFIRRSFEDNELYKAVFRAYLTFLIREGYTQEFFIEGGRTRTGKILTPKLGMLSAIVNVFGHGVRQDLYFVPVSIHYGRIPEEEAYRREVSGEAKERESFGALLRARSVLSRRYGTAHVSYGPPVSLRDAMGPLLERVRHGVGDPAVEEEKRRFIQRLGFRLLREVNAAAVAGATAVSAAALLGAPAAACRHEAFLEAARALVGLLRMQGVHLTASLLRNEASSFRESLGWLESGGLLERRRDPDGIVLFVPAEKRIPLDFYKNNIIHFFLVPSLATRALLSGVPVADVAASVAWWLDTYRWEFPLPLRETLAPDLERLLAYYRATGALVGDVLDAGHAVVGATAGLLENFREAYTVGTRVVAARRDWPVGRSTLLAEMREQFGTSLLLGDVRRPEGASLVLFGNLLSRLGELGHVTVSRRPGVRDPLLEPGPAFDRLPDLVRQLRA